MGSVDISTSDLVILILVLIIKQSLNIVHMVVFYSTMIPLMRYVRGILILLAIGFEVLFAFSLSIGISITAGIFLTIISFLEVATSFSFIPFDYRFARPVSSPATAEE